MGEGVRDLGEGVYRIDRDAVCWFCKKPRGGNGDWPLFLVKVGASVEAACRSCLEDRFPAAKFGRVVPEGVDAEAYRRAGLVPDDE